MRGCGHTCKMEAIKKKRDLAVATLKARLPFLFQLSRSRPFKYGLPMVLFMVIGSFGLAEFTSIRVQQKDERTRMLTSEEMLQLKKKRTSMEEEHEKIQNDMDLNDWTNTRGPRFWEEDTLKQLPTYDVNSKNS